jgi:hypothetical protein
MHYDISLILYPFPITPTSFLPATITVLSESRTRLFSPPRTRYLSERAVGYPLSLIRPSPPVASTDDGGSYVLECEIVPITF